MKKETNLKLKTDNKAYNVLYCYAHKDIWYREELEKHLTPLKRQGIINSWHDYDILPGTKWADKISSQLEKADIILLLISPDFIYSDYCYSIEMKYALKKHLSGDIHVIPIIIRSIDWSILPIGCLQALPTGGKPVKDWRNRDGAFQDIAKGIRKIIEASHSD